MKKTFLAILVLIIIMSVCFTACTNKGADNVSIWGNATYKEDENGVLQINKDSHL